MNGRPGILMRSSHAALDAPMAGRSSAGAFVEIGGEGIIQRARGFVARLTDAQLALAISALLFALTAWPVALTDVPPFQDLPNHLAAITIITHPERYPEFAFNGFIKTNAALFTWLYFVGKAFGVQMAGRLFALVVLATNAIVFPSFVLQMTRSRTKLVVASLLVWPMIHNWFVSMGMLDFALGVPLALVMVMLLERHSRAPSWKLAVLVPLVGAFTWYAHVFALMLVHLLVAIHVVTRRSWSDRVEQAKRLVLPLLPVTTLVLISLYQHVTEPIGEMSGYIVLGRLLPPWELFYNMWAEWFYGFTWLSITSLVPLTVLTIYAFIHREREVPFFSKWALLAIFALYFFSPYVTTNWFHVNSRFIPFFWMAALVRVPDRLPRWLVGALAFSAVLYSAGMGIDYVRLDRDRAQFTAGIAAVPEGAKLLPLLFRRQVTSENTRSLLHAWGFYVIEKQTSAPLLFAHSRSFPVMYKTPPPPRFNHLVLESFAPTMGTPEWMCGSLRSSGVVVDDCEAAWRDRWREFWSDATPRYDHVLMWDPTPEAQALVPPVYRATFHEDRLTIYERVDSKMASRDEPAEPRN